MTIARAQYQNKRQQKIQKFEILVPDFKNIHNKETEPCFYATNIRDFPNNHELYFFFTSLKSTEVSGGS